MNDSMGKLPKIKSKDDALKEILTVSQDKRGHILMDDHCKWLELKLKAVGIFAKKGLKCK